MITPRVVSQLTQLLRMFVLPELERRKNNRIAVEEPLDLRTFRAYQKKLQGNKALPMVELNEEVKPLFEVKPEKKISENELKEMVGKTFSLSDIGDECYMLPPEYNGEKCAFFYFHRMFLNPILIFDCRPNLPEITEDELKKLRTEFPLKEQICNLMLLQSIGASDKMKILKEHNWPPSPGFYPEILIKMQQQSGLIEKEEFNSLVISKFNENYWKQQISLWENLSLFPKRVKYVKASIESYLTGNYICSIYTICPQIEGVINDYLDECRQDSSGNRKNVDTLRSLLYSRKILINPKTLIDIIFDFLKDGTFFKGRSSKKDSRKQVCRNGVTHGVFYDFESQEIALKYLLLLDALAFIILSDKIVADAEN